MSEIKGIAQEKEGEKKKTRRKSLAIEADLGKDRGKLKTSKKEPSLTNFKSPKLRSINENGDNEEEPASLTNSNQHLSAPEKSKTKRSSVIIEGEPEGKIRSKIEKKKICYKI